MSIQYIQPPELLDAKRFGFTQVVTSPPGTLVFVSGQTALDANVQIVGGDDVGQQAEAALENLGHALRAASATPADITHLRVFVVDYDPGVAGPIAKAVVAFAGDSPPPAQTLIGVQALAVPGLRIEIEAVAVIGG